MSTPNRPLSAHEFLALPTSGIPFIPELHTDDCEDVTCARCVPAEQVAAEAVLREQVARHTAAKDWDEDELVAFHEAIQLVTHPDAPVSTESGDPVWDAWLAARITETRAAWTAAHTKAGGQA